MPRHEDDARKCDGDIAQPRVALGRLRAHKGAVLRLQNSLVLKTDAVVLDWWQQQQRQRHILGRVDSNQCKRPREVLENVLCTTERRQTRTYSLFCTRMFHANLKREGVESLHTDWHLPNVVRVADAAVNEHTCTMQETQSGRTGQVEHVWMPR